MILDTRKKGLFLEIIVNFVIHKLPKDFTNRKKTNRAVVSSPILLTFLKTGSTDATFQPSGK